MESTDGVGKIGQRLDVICVWVCGHWRGQVVGEVERLVRESGKYSTAPKYPDRVAGQDLARVDFLC